MKNATPSLRLIAISAIVLLMAACNNKPTTPPTPAADTTAIAAKVPPPGGAGCSYVPGVQDSIISAVTDITFSFNTTTNQISINYKGKCIQVFGHDTLRTWYTYKDAGSHLHFVDSPSIRSLTLGNTFRYPVSGTDPTSFTLSTEGSPTPCVIGIDKGDLRNDFGCAHNTAEIQLNMDNSSIDNITKYVTVDIQKIGTSFIFMASHSLYPNTSTTPPDDASSCPNPVTKKCL